MAPASHVNRRRPGPILRRLLRAPARLYDWNLGWLLGRRFLRLTHIGRRSGRSYQTVLEVIEAGRESGEIIVVAALGSQSDWYSNLQAHPATEIAIGRCRFQPEHRFLHEFETVDAIANYERRNRWLTPVIRRVLSWLVGWNYNGSSDARHRLACQLPAVAFRRHLDQPGGRADTSSPER